MSRRSLLASVGLMVVGGVMFNVVPAYADMPTIDITVDGAIRHCPIFCAGGRLSSSDDEPFAEDHGELAFRLTPFPRRPFPFVCCVIEHEV